MIDPRVVYSNMREQGQRDASNVEVEFKELNKRRYTNVSVL